MVTLDQALDTVMQLPPDQQEMLLDILHKRTIETRRAEIAHDAQESLAAFRAGELRAQPVQEVIAELRQFCEAEDEE